MAKGYVCERCERSDIFVTWVCQNCHRGVCRECIVFINHRQLCLDCVDTKEGVRIDEPEVVPA